MSNMSVEDIMDTICAKWDVSEFVERFELTIEEMVVAFKEKIEEQCGPLPYELDMEQEAEGYDDRES